MVTSTLYYIIVAMDEEDKLEYDGNRIAPIENLVGARIEITGKQVLFPMKMKWISTNYIYFASEYAHPVTGHNFRLILYNTFLW